MCIEKERIGGEIWKFMRGIVRILRIIKGDRNLTRSVSLLPALLPQSRSMSSMTSAAAWFTRVICSRSFHALSSSLPSTLVFNQCTISIARVAQPCPSSRSFSSFFSHISYSVVLHHDGMKFFEIIVLEILFRFLSYFVGIKLFPSLPGRCERFKLIISVRFRATNARKSNSDWYCDINHIPLGAAFLYWKK